MKVNEIFTSIQGEGPNTGKLSCFIRLSGCNLRCSLCDSKHSWGLGGDAIEMSIDEIIAEMKIRHMAVPFNNVVITGGEPFVHQEGLKALISNIHYNGFYNATIEIETNGSLVNKLSVLPYLSINVSPKLKSFKQDYDIIPYSQDSLRSYAEFYRMSGCLKFVVSDKSLYDDIEEIRDIQTAMSGIPSKCIYLMPEGIDPVDQAESIKNIIDKTKHLGYNYSLRQHIIIWGNTRGK